MKLVDIFTTYVHYLIHPFKTHEYFLNPERASDDEFKPVRLTSYESLATSWLFVVVNGIFKIIILNFSILFMLNLFEDNLSLGTDFINISEFPGFYFLILSSFLDIIFYPLFGIFIIQFWEVVIKFFGGLLDSTGDLSQKSHDIMSVYFSSSILNIIPFVGASIQGLASMVLMYAGLRKQLNASPVLSVCIILTPLLFILGFISVLMLILLIAL